MPASPSKERWRSAHAQREPTLRRRPAATGVGSAALLGGITLAVCLVGGASAQTGAAVVTQAQDAFGQRVGTESIGLYSESRVRGFSLQNAGNFRIDDHYFVRGGDLPDPIVDRVTIEVGVNAVDAEFPAPSGLVDFRLKRPATRDSGLTLTTGLRAYGTPFVQFDGWASAAGGQGDLIGGVVLSPNITFPDGTRGEEYEAGLVARRAAGPLRLTAFAGWKHREYNGDYSFSHSGDALPPTLGRGVQLFGPGWARFKKRDLNLGAMGTWDAGAGWQLTGGVFHSSSDRPAADFTTLELNSPTTAVATLALSRDQSQWSRSAEASVSRTFAMWNASHRLVGAVRVRRSHARTTPGESISLGLVDLGDLDYPASSPHVADGGDYTATAVDQVTLGVAYRLAVGEDLQFRLGLQSSDYRKAVTLNGETRRSRDRPWLIDGLAAWSPSRRTLLYGSYVRGLEEAGVAPNSAANRNEILPAVLAEQLELGLRYRLTPSLTLIAAAFEISKPAAGFDNERNYGLIGDVSHRGLELSLSGRPVPDLSLAAGVLLLRPRTTGPAVESGQMSSRPVGLPPTVFQVSADYRLPAHPALSLDAQLDFSSAAPGNLRDTFRAPAVTTLSLGARYRLPIAGRPSVIRARVQNVADAGGWTVRPSADLARQRGRSFMVQLEVPLSGGPP